MSDNIARTLNDLGVSLSSIARMSKLPRANNETARRWCRKGTLPPRVHASLSRAALVEWGEMARVGDPNAEILWEMMDLAKHPNLVHVLVYVCDVPISFLCREASVGETTVDRWLYQTGHLAHETRDRLSGLYRSVWARLDRQKEYRSARILNEAWKRTKEDYS